jgi:uncharacterized protein (DUF488 family)
MATVFTIGHSNHPIERFIALLKQHSMKVLVDVRSRPASRFAPQFNRKALEQSLKAEGIDYVYLGDLLGGRARSDTSETVAMDFDTRIKDDAFQKGLDELVDISVETSTAIMCAEKDPSDCHRSFLVGRVLTKRGHTIRHILADGGLSEQNAELL